MINSSILRLTKKIETDCGFECDPHSYRAFTVTPEERQEGAFLWKIKTKAAMGTDRDNKTPCYTLGSKYPIKKCIKDNCHLYVTDSKSNWYEVVEILCDEI